MSGAAGERNTSPLIRFYFVAFIVVLFDQLTKGISLSNLSYYESLPLIENVFHLTLVRNTGVAFGLFRDHPAVLHVLISVSLVALVIWVHASKQLLTRHRLAMALILGGAIGNWIDRLRWGAVIDFLDFRVWPVFNFADCGISVGVGLYILALIQESRKSKQIPS